MPKARILILSAKFGEGHYQAGEALASALRTQMSSKDAVSHLDFGRFFHSKTDVLLRKAYFNLISKTPELWRLIYQKTAGLTAASCKKFRYGLNSKSLLHFIRETKPDVIVSTHFIPAGILAEYKKQGLIRTPLATVITDYLVHGVWIHSGVDLNLVGCREGYNRLIKRGIPPEKVMLTGIPVRPPFTNPPAQVSARLKLKLAPDRPTVLVMGGIAGIAGKNPDIVSLLGDLAANHAAQLILVCGHDEDLYRSLYAQLAKQSFKTAIFGYAENVHVLMAAADFIITKGGALTLSEALTVGLPILVYKPIPGHEDGNACFVEKAGAGIKVNSLSELQGVSRDLLHNPDRLAEMRLAAGHLLPANSAVLAANSILALAEKEKKQKDCRTEAII